MQAQTLESSRPCESRQIVQITPSGMKAGRKTRSVLLARKISNDQAPSGFEHVVTRLLEPTSLPSGTVARRQGRVEERE